MRQDDNASELADRLPWADRSRVHPTDTCPAWPSPATILPQETGLLLSGGLDSAVLLGLMLDHGSRVVPFYVRTGCVWQDPELSANKPINWNASSCRFILLRLPKPRVGRSSRLGGTIFFNELRIRPICH